jgi:hypothetical protein
MVEVLSFFAFVLFLFLVCVLISFVEKISFAVERINNELEQLNWLNEKIAEHDLPSLFQEDPTEDILNDND